MALNLNQQQPKTLKPIASDLRASGMRCNCDLDNWEPEANTGHSHVCRIHKAALAQFRSSASTTKTLRVNDS